jgi:CO/xanthine dehydrogenase Mo-binding subunit
MSSRGDNGLKWVGKSIPRKEDPKLLIGKATFVDDVLLPRMTHAAILMSPYAHARIVSIDTSRALALPGVVAVVTGKDAAQQTGHFPTLSNPPVKQYCIAVDKARYVGEPVAAVVAETRYIAEDALALIDVEYEVLPSIPDIERSLAASGDGVLHPELGDSNVFTQVERKWGPVDELFGKAARVVKRTFRWPRVSAQPIETAGAVADYEPVTRRFTIYSNMSQQMALSPRLAQTLGVAAHQMNFYPMYVGGSFGGKVSLFHVPILAATLARIVGRPVKYMEDRLEHLLNGNQHGSDRQYETELAIDSDGKFLALRLQVVDDYGAYFQMALGSHGNALAQATGPYRISALHYAVTAVATNKTQQGPYRGFGGEVGNFVLERLVDAAAKELGVDPIVLRRKNFISREEFPYKIPNGNVYDSGDYHAVLEEAIAVARPDEWKARKAANKDPDKRIGIGFATVCERSVLSSTEFWFLDDNAVTKTSSSPESVQVRIDAGGMAVVTIYAPCWGNSPETMAAQLVAESLSIHPDRIFVNYGNTDSGLISKGPAGSRYTAMLAGAIGGACRLLKTKLLKLGSHRLGVSEEEVELVDNGVAVKGRPDSMVTLPDLARAAHLFRLDFPQDDSYNSGLVAAYTYDHPYTTLPDKQTGDLGVFYPIVGHACHAVLVEVDIALGTVRFLDYVAVHDVGRVVNPMTMNGQIRGGIAQGIGTVLYEKYQYDDEGQALTGSLADYLIPTACEIPDIRISHVETPSPFTEFGIKGGGEGGRLAASPAIVAAIEDALTDFDIYLNELPLTPGYLRGLIEQSNRTDEG